MMKYIFVLLLLLAACNSEVSKYPQYDAMIHFGTENKKDLNNYSAIFLLPSSGCDDCISTAESYLIDDYNLRNKKGVLFIITGLTSEKTAKLRFGSKVFVSKDVLFDYQNRFSSLPYLQMYPKLFFLQKGMIIKVQESGASTGEDVYANLNKITKTKY